MCKLACHESVLLLLQINEKLSQVSSSISILVGIALISSNAFGFKVL
jgi:hypothetical protein